MFKSPLSLFIFALFLVPIGSGFQIDEYISTFQMKDDTVFIEINILFNESISENISFRFPPSISDLSIQLNEQIINSIIFNNSVELNLDKTNQISIQYSSDYFKDGDDFLYDFISPLDISSFKISLILPPGAKLEEPLKGGEGSIYPKPTESTTDGEHFIFTWNQANLIQGENIAFYTKIENKNSFPLYPIIIAFLFLSSLIIYFFKKKSKENRSIESHLKEDELEIVSILKKRENTQIEQGTLRIITGHAKATLSRILKELEERNIIHKEKRGKKNLVFLK